ncbi:MAG: Holliday junction branch migration protein RuvA [bacterium]
MIAYLQGKIIDKHSQYLILLVNGVGYKVFVSLNTLADCQPEQEVGLHTYQQVKEDGLALYGFLQAEELELFELLISVSGIGPKSGLNVLSIAGVDDVKQSIALNDPSLLTKVSGIGKKTAERIVLELKNKIGILPSLAGQANGLSGASEEIDALIQLGYSLTQARQALQQVDSSITDSAQRLKAALKIIQ